MESFTKAIKFKGEFNFAQPTGLEPATPAVTGRCSDQLSYGCLFFYFNLFFCFYQIVAGAGFEPATSGLWARRATIAPPRDFNFLFYLKKQFIARVIHNLSFKILLLFVISY